MRHRLAVFTALFTIAAITLPYAHATDQPSNDDVPRILEFVQQTPDTGTNTEPSGKFKELAAKTIERLKQSYTKASFKAVVNQPDDKDEKARLLIISAVVSEPIALSFKSNCSVNSQFHLSQETVQLLTELERKDPKALQEHWLTDVCATWTLYNHDWLNADAGVPKTFRISVNNYGGTPFLDITYKREEVDAYKQATANLSKISTEKLARR